MMIGIWYLNNKLGCNYLCPDLSLAAEVNDSTNGFCVNPVDQTKTP